MLRLSPDAALRANKSKIDSGGVHVFSVEHRSGPCFSPCPCLLETARLAAGSACREFNSSLRAMHAQSARPPPALPLRLPWANSVGALCARRPVGPGAFPASLAVLAGPSPWRGAATGPAGAAGRRPMAPGRASRRLVRRRGATLLALALALAQPVPAASQAECPAIANPGCFDQEFRGN